MKKLIKNISDFSIKGVFGFFKCLECGKIKFSFKVIELWKPRLLKNFKGGQYGRVCRKCYTDVPF